MKWILIKNKWKKFKWRFYSKKKKWYLRTLIDSSLPDDYYGNDKYNE